MNNLTQQVKRCREKVKGIEEKVKDLGEKAKLVGAVTYGITGLAMGFALFYTGVTITLNLPPMAMQAGIEYLLNQPKQEFIATFREKKEALLLGTHGHLDYGRFALENGDSVSLHDGPRILEGKWFANTEIEQLELGKKYRLSTIGSERWGYTLLDTENLLDAEVLNP